MRLALTILVGSLVLLGCGVKTVPGAPGSPGAPGTSPQNGGTQQDVEVLARFTLEGSAQFVLENNNYDDFTPNANCIQLVRRSTLQFVEFSAGACSSNPNPQVSLKSENMFIYLNGIKVGTWNTTGGYHINQLCSGPTYGNLCHFIVTGISLTRIDPGP